MAKKETTKISEKSSKKKKLNSETVGGIVSICFFVLGVAFILASIGKAGPVGTYTYGFLSRLMGLGYSLLPIACFMIGASFWKDFSRENFPISKIVGSLLFFSSGLGIIDTVIPGNGGTIGYLVSTPFIRLFEIYLSIFILGAIFISAILFVFETRLTIEPFVFIWKKILSAFSKNNPAENRTKTDKLVEPGDLDEEIAEEEETIEGAEDGETVNLEDDEITPKVAQSQDSDEELKGSNRRAVAASLFQWIGRTYTPPPISLLEHDRGKPIVGDIKANANIIKRTLQNFGINVEMDEVSIGPSVTRYSLKPAEGVKLSKIVALQDNLAYALAAHPIRIEAPIPGKSLVGIEIPNSTKSIVGLAGMIGSEEYGSSDKPLLMSLGKGISGKSLYGNLAKMPHLLIAGATGSGKSVTIHAIICSLLFRNSPAHMQFIMIDPKRVELTLYNKIPHLLTPVITDPKKAILALKWAAKEMERRYNVFETSAVRDLDSYHKNVLEPELKKIDKTKDSTDGDESKNPDLMPYIVIIIDELADIMTSYPRELEAAIVRLAQMSRATGIHLILSTQRPSVNVITGLIKANVPARIALQVSSQIDSRTILDTGGAEKLLGAGDMLYLGGDMAKPQRIQSAFVSETEVKKVVKYLRENYANEIPNEINLTGDLNPEAGGGSIFDGDTDDEIDDDLYEAAREEVIKAGKASTSYIQRKLRVGYSRAARLMDILEERGVIGQADGSKPREVIGPAIEQEQPPTQ